MKTEKDHEQNDDKRVYRSPQLTVFGSIAHTTQVNMTGGDDDNSGTPGFSMAVGIMTPPGQAS